MALGFAVHRSTDPGALTLTGQAGSAKALLKHYLDDWDVVFEVGDKIVLRARSGNRMYLRIDDTGSMTGGARDFTWRGYASMSDIDTGTGAFPTTLQRADANFNIRKSDTADATARPWVLFKTDRYVMLIVQHQTSGGKNGGIFGEVMSFLPGDLYPTLIGANVVASSASNLSPSGSSTYGAGYGSSVHNSGAGYIYWAGTRTSLVSTQGNKVTDGTGGGTGAARVYDASADGGIEMCPVIAQFYNGAGYVPRARIPGWWAGAYTTASFSASLDGNTWQGHGRWSGYSWLGMSFPGANTDSGAIETSNSPDLA